MFSADPIGLLAFLWMLFRSAGSSQSTPPARQLPTGSTDPYLTSTPPWPQATPQGLPAFPGSGWEYDEPPPVSVKQRAAQLVSQLWKAGKGTHKIEQTAGRWIAYRSEILRGGNRGVVAYRVKSGKRAALPNTAARPAPLPSPASPAGTPVSNAPAAKEVKLKKGHSYAYVTRFESDTPVDPAGIAKGLALAGAWQVSVEPGPPIIARYRIRAAADITLVLNRPIKIALEGFSGSITVLEVKEVSGEVPEQLPRGVPSVFETAPAALQLPDLKYGDGLRPKPPVEEVKIVQQRLRVSPVDGRFGTTTRDAVIEFQVRTGLAPNVKRAELVKRGFGAVKKATWEKLFAVQA